MMSLRASVKLILGSGARIERQGPDDRISAFSLHTGERLWSMTVPRDGPRGDGDDAEDPWAKVLIPGHRRLYVLLSSNALLCLEESP